MPTDNLKASIDKIRAVMHEDGLIGCMVLLSQDLDKCARITTLQHKDTLFIRDPVTGNELVDPAVLATIAAGRVTEDELKRAVTTLFIIDTLNDEAVRMLDMLIDLAQISKRVKRKLGQ